MYIVVLMLIWYVTFSCTCSRNLPRIYIYIMYRYMLNEIQIICNTASLENCENIFRVYIYSYIPACVLHLYMCYYIKFSKITAYLYTIKCIYVYMLHALYVSHNLSPLYALVCSTIILCVSPTRHLAIYIIWDMFCFVCQPSEIRCSM